MTRLRFVIGIVQLLLGALGHAIQVSANVVLLPGVAVLALVRWFLLRLRDIPIEFGPWWSPESRGVAPEDDPIASEAYVYLLGVIVLTGLGLLLLLPELIREAALGVPIFKVNWQDDGIIDSAIRIGGRDLWRGVAIWFGLSFLVVSPLDSAELGRVIAGLRTGHTVSRVGASALIPLRGALWFAGPLEAIGRIGVGAAWAAGLLWLASLFF